MWISKVVLWVKFETAAAIYPVCVLQLEQEVIAWNAQLTVRFACGQWVSQVPWPGQLFIVMNRTQ